MMLKKRGERKQLLLSRFITILLVFSVFIASVEAQEAALDVTTVIVVNNEADMDNAIASAISRELGIPVLYTGTEEVSRELIAELQTGIYRNVKNVVLLGENSFISSNVKQSLTIAGVVGGFDVVRVGGITETDTALNAITYFYGPGVLEGVTLVENRNNELVSLSAHLSYPLIPITPDQGLPENVYEFLNSTKSNYANIILYSEDLNLKQDLVDLNVRLNKEFYGSSNEIERNLKTRSLQDNKIVFVEKDKLPPFILNSILIYYEDEDNDGLDDKTETELEEFLTLNYEENDNYEIENVYFYSDDQRRLAKIESNLLKKNIPIEAISYETSEDLTYNSLELNKDNLNEINKNFLDKTAEMKDRFEDNQEEFEKKIVHLINQIEVFYSLQEDNLPVQAIVTAKGVLDPSNDVFIRWKLANAFVNEYMS